MIGLILQAVGWGLAMTFSALASLWMSTGLLTGHLNEIILMCFFSSTLGYVLAMVSVRIFVRKVYFETKFAGTFFFLAVMTIGCNLLFYCIDYWLFYSQWHAPIFSKTWIFQTIFTNLGAAFQFAVLGLQLFLPVGLIFLIIVSFMKSRPYLVTNRSGAET